MAYDKKILWIDLETSSLDTDMGAILEIAALVDINDEIVEEYNSFMAPFPGAYIDDEALRVNGHDYNKIFDFPPVESVMIEFENMLKKHINQFNRLDKFVLAGKNISAFDVPFLQNYFLLMDNKYFGSYFHRVHYDINFLIAKFILEKRNPLRKLNLGDLCEYFDVDLPQAHSGISDIKATRELFKKLEEILKDNDDL